MVYAPKLVVSLPTRDMYARARELTRKPERGVTRTGSGGPTFRNIGGTVSSPYSYVVAPTAGHEDSLQEAGALSKTMDPSPLEGPCREAVATILLAISSAKFWNVLVLLHSLVSIQQKYTQ